MVRNDSHYDCYIKSGDTYVQLGDTIPIPENLVTLDDLEAYVKKTELTDGSIEDIIAANTISAQEFIEDGASLKDKYLQKADLESGTVNLKNINAENVFVTNKITGETAEITNGVFNNVTINRLLTLAFGASVEGHKWSISQDGDILCDSLSIDNVNGLTIADENIYNYVKRIAKQYGSGTKDYSDLSNKPSINDVVLSGNKTAEDLGLATEDGYIPNEGNYVNSTITPNFTLRRDRKINLQGDIGIDLNGANNIDLTTVNYTLTAPVIREESRDVQIVSTKDVSQSILPGDITLWANDGGKAYYYNHHRLTDDEIEQMTDEEYEAYIEEMEALHPTREILVKGDTYSKSEINDMLASGLNINYKVVDELPQSDISTSTVYLILDDQAVETIYKQYMYIDDTWVQLGSTGVDLTNYAQLSDLDDYLPLAGGTMTGSIGMNIGHNFHIWNANGLNNRYYNSSDQLIGTAQLYNNSLGYQTIHTDDGTTTSFYAEGSNFNIKHHNSDLFEITTNHLLYKPSLTGTYDFGNTAMQVSINNAQMVLTNSQFSANITDHSLVMAGGNLRFNNNILQASSDVLAHSGTGHSVSFSGNAISAVATNVYGLNMTSSIFSATGGASGDNYIFNISNGDLSIYTKKVNDARSSLMLQNNLFDVKLANNDEIHFTSTNGLAISTSSDAYLNANGNVYIDGNLLHLDSNAGATQIYANTIALNPGGAQIPQTETWYGDVSTIATDEDYSLNIQQPGPAIQWTASDTLTALTQFTNDERGLKLGYNATVAENSIAPTLYLHPFGIKAIKQGAEMGSDNADLVNFDIKSVNKIHFNNITTESNITGPAIKLGISENEDTLEAICPGPASWTSTTEATEVLQDFLQDNGGLKIIHSGAISDATKPYLFISPLGIKGVAGTGAITSDLQPILSGFKLYDTNDREIYATDNIVIKSTERSMSDLALDWVDYNASNSRGIINSKKLSFTTIVSDVTFYDEDNNGARFATSFEYCTLPLDNVRLTFTNGEHIFKNCYFEGEGVIYVQPNAKVTFENCTFTEDVDVTSLGNANITMIGCSCNGTVSITANSVTPNAYVCGRIINSSISTVNCTNENVGTETDVMIQGCYITDFYSLGSGSTNSKLVFNNEIVNNY